MNINTIKIVVFGVLVALTGVQCWGAARAVEPSVSEHHIDVFIQALRSGDDERAKDVLGWEIDVNGVSRDGDPILMLAVVRGRVEIVKELFLAGARIDTRDQKGYRCLDMARAFLRDFPDDAGVREIATIFEQANLSAFDYQEPAPLYTQEPTFPLQPAPRYTPFQEPAPAYTPPQEPAPRYTPPQEPAPEDASR